MNEIKLILRLFQGVMLVVICYYMANNANEAMLMNQEKLELGLMLFASSLTVLLLSLVVFLEAMKIILGISKES